MRRDRKDDYAARLAIEERVTWLNFEIDTGVDGLTTADKSGIITLSISRAQQKEMPYAPAA